MSFATRNSCICSSCFKRQHEIHVNDHRHTVSRKRCKSFSVRKIEKQVWRMYLEKLKPQITRERQIAKLPMEHIEVVREIGPSEIFVETPTNVNSRSLILDVNCQNFWDFVNGQSWEGRVRVCEGELMYRLRETLKMLVRLGKVTDFTVTRVFTAQSVTSQEHSVPEEKSPGLVVRVEQTYYGGVPKKTKKKVSFNLVPDSAFIPRLKCVSPILKSAWYKTTPVNITSQNTPNITPDINLINGHDAGNEPTLRRKATSENKPESVCNLSASVAKEDFATICLQATQHFIVVREMVTSSRTIKSSTSFTFRRKENLSGTSKIAETMNDFYTSKTLVEHFDKTPEFKPSTPLLGLKI